jgi:hypothetical protein
MNNQKNDEKKLKVLFNRNNQMLAGKSYLTLTDKVLGSIKEGVEKKIYKRIERNPQYLETVNFNTNIPKFINGNITGCRQRTTLKATINKLNKVNITKETPEESKRILKNVEERRRKYITEIETSEEYAKFTKTILTEWSTEILSNIFYNVYKSQIHNKLNIKGVLEPKDIIANPILVYFTRPSSSSNKLDKYVFKFVSDIKSLVNDQVKSTRKVNRTSNDDYNFVKATKDLQNKMKIEQDSKKKLFEDAIKSIENKRNRLGKNTQVKNTSNLKKQIAAKRKEVEEKRLLVHKRLRERLQKQSKANARRSQIKKPVGVFTSLQRFFK